MSSLYLLDSNPLLELLFAKSSASLPKLLLFVSACSLTVCSSASSSLCSFLFELFLCVPPFTPKSFSLPLFPCSHGSGPPFYSLVPCSAAVAPCQGSLPREPRPPLTRQTLNSPACCLCPSRDVSHVCAFSVAKIHRNACRELWDLLWQLPGLMVEKKNSGPELYPVF